MSSCLFVTGRSDACFPAAQPKSGAGPATQEAPRDTDEDAIESRTCRDGIQPASTLTSDEAIPAVPIEAGDDAAGTRTRSRSVSCRSRFRSADAEVWSTRRSRSSGPPGRERCSTAGDRTCEEASALGSMTRRRRRRREPEAPAGRVPWGAGPRAPGARARAHAWAHSQLASSGRGVGVAHRGSRKAGGCCSGHSCNGRGEPSSGRSARHLASTSRVGNQSLRESRTRRGKATKRAWEEGGGEVDKTPYSSGISGTGATEYPGRTAGLDKPNRKRDLGTGDEREPCPVSDPAFSLVESGEPSKSRGGDVVAPAAPEEAHHDPGSSLKEDAGPRGERQEAGSTTSPDTAPEADRTARVVRMLAALEEVVAVVCQVCMYSTDFCVRQVSQGQLGDVLLRGKLFVIRVCSSAVRRASPANGVTVTHFAGWCRSMHAGCPCASCPAEIRFRNLLSPRVPR